MCHLFPFSIQQHAILKNAKFEIVKWWCCVNSFDPIQNNKNQQKSEKKKKKKMNKKEQADPLSIKGMVKSFKCNKTSFS